MQKKFAEEYRSLVKSAITLTRDRKLTLLKETGFLQQLGPSSFLEQFGKVTVKLGRGLGATSMIKSLAKEGDILVTKFKSSDLDRRTDPHLFLVVVPIPDSRTPLLDILPKISKFVATYPSPDRVIWFDDLDHVIVDDLIYEFTWPAEALFVSLGG